MCVRLGVRLMTCMLLVSLGSTEVTLTSVPLHNDGCHVIVKTTNGSRHVDLSKLENQRHQLNDTEKKGAYYIWNVCPPSISSATQCVNQSIAYQDIEKCTEMGNRGTFSMERGKLLLEIHPNTTNTTDNIQGAVITLECSYADEQRLECGDKISCTGHLRVKFTFKAKQFCFEEEPQQTVKATPLTPTNNGKSYRDWVKLSPGSIVLIAFGCVSFTYMFLGLAYGIGKGEKGLNRLPNSDFWLELPILVKDGAAFIFRGCKTSGVEYSLIKEDKTVPIVDV